MGINFNAWLVSMQKNRKIGNSGCMRFIARLVVFCHTAHNEIFIDMVYGDTGGQSCITLQWR